MSRVVVFVFLLFLFTGFSTGNADSKFKYLPAIELQEMYLDDCEQMLGKLKVVWSNKEFFDMGDRRFSIIDGKWGFSFEAIIFDGILDITAVLAIEEAGVRSRYSGERLYAGMMKHFDSDNIVAINGTWTEGSNFDEFYANLKKGMSRTDAARKTWSGRQAAKYGFTEVIFYPSSDIKDEELWVNLIFLRPEHREQWDWIEQ